MRWAWTKRIDSGKVEDQMPKKQTVKFKVTGDGLEPKKVEWAVAVRAPVEVTVPPKQTRVIDLLVKSDVALLLLPHPNLKAFLPECKFTFPEEVIKVTVTNNGDRPVKIEDRSTVVFAVPLSFDFDVGIE